MKNNCNSFIAAIDAVFGVWNHGKKIGGVCTTTTTKKLFPLTIFFVKSHENSQNDESNAPLMLWYVSKRPNYYNYNSKTVHQLVCDLDRNFFLREIADIMTIIVVDKKIFLRWIVCVHSGLVKANKKGNNKKIIKNQSTSLQEIT